jgi:hypothetical protein
MTFHGPRGSLFGPPVIPGAFPFRAEISAIGRLPGSTKHKTIHNMKTKLINTILLLTLTVALARPASAQTTTNLVTILTNAPVPPSSPAPLPTLPASFFATIQSYLTSVDTNFTWVSNRLEAAAGGDYQGGVQWASYVSGQLDLGRWDLESKIRNVGLGGALESIEAGGGYTLIQDGSLKIQGSLLAGYDFTRHLALVEPQAVLKKKTTRNTYIELGVGLPLWLEKPINNRPNFFIGVGFTY